MYLALTQVCRQALAVGRLTDDQARIFFEHIFARCAYQPRRQCRILTGYYEPIVDGSRFPTGIFKVPIYRRPPDLVPPRNSTGPGFPNKGQSLRRTSSGALVPYYDRGEILDGALDGKHLEICWIRNQLDALRSRSRDQRACVSKTVLRCASTTMPITAIHSCRSTAFSSSVILFHAANVDGAYP